MKKGLSVVICTYNGASRLAETLRHIALQKVPRSVNWEVLLIDNASTDNSAQIAKTAWTTYDSPVPLRILHQPLAGLSYARDMGFTEALYEYIVLCDDDNWLDSNYLVKSYTIMQHHPTVGLLGGHGNLVYETPPPKWVINYPIHAEGTQLYKPTLIRSYGIYGAGCVLRKTAYQVLRSAGFTFLLTDRKGTKLSTGGDMELCYAIALAGYDIYYDESLQFSHFVSNHRTTWNYYIEFLYEDARSHIVLEPYRIQLNLKTDNLIAFKAMLLINFISRWFYLLYKIMIKAKRKLTLSDTNEINLKIMWLRTRLGIYKNHAQMADIFRKAALLRQHFTR